VIEGISREQDAKPAADNDPVAQKGQSNQLNKQIQIQIGK
jgi:hypothetical protein